MDYDHKRLCALLIRKVEKNELTWKDLALACLEYVHDSDLEGMAYSFGISDYDNPDTGNLEQQ